MPSVSDIRARLPLAVAALLAIVALHDSAAAQAQRRPMTFLDMQLMSSAGSFTTSPDGRWLLYTVSVLDWKEARRQTDIHLVSVVDGLPSARQLTFTEEK